MQRLISGLVLSILFPSLGLAQTAKDSWEDPKQLSAGQKTEAVDGNAISLRVKGAQIAAQRADVVGVSVLENSKRLRNTVIGMGIGAAGGLTAGALAGPTYHEEGETDLLMLLAVPVGTGAGATVRAAIPTGTRSVYGVDEVHGG